MSEPSPRDLPLARLLALLALDPGNVTIRGEILRREQAAAQLDAGGRVHFKGREVLPCGGSPRDTAIMTGKAGTRPAGPGRARRMALDPDRHKPSERPSPATEPGIARSGKWTTGRKGNAIHGPAYGESSRPAGEGKREVAVMLTRPDGTREHVRNGFRSVTPPRDPVPDFDPREDDKLRAARREREMLRRREERAKYKKDRAPS